jgi:hypothetical protein
MNHIKVEISLEEEEGVLPCRIRKFLTKYNGFLHCPALSGKENIEILQTVLILLCYYVGVKCMSSGNS